MNPIEEPTQEQEAFGRLVAHHYAAVAAIAFAATRDLALSEDVAQDTFIAAWDSRRQLRELARIRPWLCAIARNRSKNALRRRKRELEFDEEAASGAPSAEDHPDLRAALGKVPLRYREPLVLFYWHEQSIREVASVLAISEEAAQKRISRARRYVREALAAELEGVGRKRRPAAEAAAAIVAVLAARTTVAHAEIVPAQSALARVAFRIGHPVGLMGLGATLVAAVVWWRGPQECVEAAVVPVQFPVSHEKQLANLGMKVRFIELENDARDETATELEGRLSQLEQTDRPSAKRRPRDVTPGVTIEPISATVVVEPTPVAPRSERSATSPSCGSPSFRAEHPDIARQADSLARRGRLDETDYDALLQCFLMANESACCKQIDAALRDCDVSAPPCRQPDGGWR